MSCALNVLCAIPALFFGADSPATFSEFARSSTTIVDATIREYTDQGHAVLTVHSAFLGKESPKLLTGIRTSSTTPLVDLLPPGRRAVLFLQGTELSDSTARFAVRDRDGQIEYECRDWRNATKPEWMTAARLAEAIRIARAVRIELSEAVIDPAKPTDAVLRCFIRNEADKPIVLAKGYRNDAARLISGRLSLVMHEQRKPPSLEKDQPATSIEIAPGDEALLFELPLSEILLIEGGRPGRWSWNWPRRSEPPRSPLYKWREPGLNDEAVFEAIVDFRESGAAARAVPGESPFLRFGHSERLTLKIRKSN